MFSTDYTFCSIIKPPCPTDLPITDTVVRYLQYMICKCFTFMMKRKLRLTSFFFVARRISLNVTWQWQLLNMPDLSRSILVTLLHLARSRLLRAQYLGFRNTSFREWGLSLPLWCRHTTCSDQGILVLLHIGSSRRYVHDVLLLITSFFSRRHDFS